MVYASLHTFKIRVFTISTDETFFAGSFAPLIKREISVNNPKKSDFFKLIYKAIIPRNYFIINLKTSNLDRMLTEKAWKDYVKLSPTDPIKPDEK